MKTKLYYLPILICLSIFFVSCNKTKKDSHPKMKTKDEYGENFNREMQSYYAFAKTAETEYQLDSFINKLTLVRAANVKKISNEENWLNHLAWLKLHGSKVLSVTESGVPNLSVRDKSPYENSTAVLAK